MIEKKLILLTIWKDGSVSAETKGLKGKDCLSSISLLENLLDAEVQDSTYTQEFYDLTSQNESTNLGTTNV